jgi:hypothetical protein
MIGHIWLGGAKLTWLVSSKRIYDWLGQICPGWANECGDMIGWAKTESEDMIVTKVVWLVQSNGKIWLVGSKLTYSWSNERGYMIGWDKTDQSQRRYDWLGQNWHGLPNQMWRYYCLVQTGLVDQMKKSGRCDWLVQKIWLARTKLTWLGGRWSSCKSPCSQNIKCQIPEGNRKLIRTHGPASDRKFYTKYSHKKIWRIFLCKICLNYYQDDLLSFLEQCIQVEKMRQFWIK